ncbi:MAG: acyl-CoA dehydrogenase [Planctomycetes bacterium]|nr:acyl-CoA dehydrogenase [Planctomycetota bacterium]
MRDTPPSSLPHPQPTPERPHAPPRAPPPALLLALTLLYLGRGYLAWVLPLAAVFATWALYHPNSATTPLFLALAIPFLVLAALFGLPPLRRAVVTAPVMRALSRIFPKMSDTERTALDAGTVWWDAELFSGKPNWSRILEFTPKPLSPREQSFLDHEVRELLALVDDYDVHQKGDLSPAAWDFIKKKKFMGIIIPESYGGLGFSALANSTIVTRISTHSTTAAVTVMVPNSLGPAELLLHYGTDEQKKTYLPRLAVGDEVPCFALTEPHAGSDAGGMQAVGVVCKGTFQGREITGMRLSWDKRYITLAPVATLIGLAFKLRDPERLLGGEVELGITCALIPRSTPGVEIGERHDPMSTPFLNGPTRGKDVFVPLEFIIGGAKMAGQGWRMLMECLSAGRSISLPANACGGAQLATRVIGAYGTVREQFNLSIGRFEGVEAPIARIAGTTYWMNAMRKVTAGAVDAGEKPAVISAIAKHWSTEAARRVIADAMDVQGGAAICKGPRNTLAYAYQGIPIGITVEGANILTRTMIVFGQGAIRCHPFAFQEMEAARKKDLAAFDTAFFGHVNFVLRNGARSFVLGLTGGALASVPKGGESGRVLKELARLSASFALVADGCMGTLGGSLKRKEMITGRLADALAWMYVAACVVKRFEDDGRPKRDEAFFRWSTREALWQVQEALAGVLDNLPNRMAAMTLRPAVFPLGKRLCPPGDRVVAACARAILDGGEARLALTPDVATPEATKPGLGALENALALTVASHGTREKLRNAVKAGTLERAAELDLVAPALAKKVISPDEANALRAAAAARDDVIQVDSFGPEAYRALRG